MEIMIHAPHLEAHDERIRKEVDHSLHRFADRLTRVEVFLKDLNAAKGGDDLRCVIEARPRGLDPVAAEHHAANAVDAATGAARKLQRLLDHRLGKLGDRHPN